MLNVKNVVALVASIVLVGTSASCVQASAASVPSKCSNAVCFYYDGNGQGAIYRVQNVDEYDMINDHYAASGDGHGQKVKNNAASASSGISSALIVFYDEGCTGVSDRVPAETLQNLVQTFNENASWVLASYGVNNCRS